MGVARLGPPGRTPGSPIRPPEGGTPPAMAACVSVRAGEDATTLVTDAENEAAPRGPDGMGGIRTTPRSSRDAALHSEPA